VASVASIGLLCGVALTAQQQKVGAPAESRDMQLVGYNDLQARSSYQPTIKRQGTRYIAYIGHHGGEKLNALTGKMEKNGTSIVDVTNPRQPKYLAHITGEEGAGEAGGAQMTRVCLGTELPRADRNKAYLLRSYGNSGHEIWDVSDPAKPSKILTLLSGLRNTHKSWWECDTGIAYVISGDPAWRTRRMTKIFDLSDPANPKFIRDFGLPGQQPGATVMPVPTELHGPISLGPKGNRVYFGYGTSRAGVLQIVDREKLLNGRRSPPTRTCSIRRSRVSTCRRTRARTRRCRCSATCCRNLPSRSCRRTRRSRVRRTTMDRMCRSTRCRPTATSSP
jgi:hypothetical protein